MRPLIGLVPLRSCDGQDLLNDNDSYLARWSEHFRRVFSTNLNKDIAIHCILPRPFRQELLEPPNIKNTTRAIFHPQCHKAAGVDGIPTEISKYDGPTIYVKRYKSSDLILEAGQVVKSFLRRRYRTLTKYVHSLSRT